MTVAGVIFLLVVRAAFSDSNYMLLLAGLVALSGLCMAAGLVPLRRGRVVSACNFLSVANWVVALGATKAHRSRCRSSSPRRGWRPLAAVSPPRTAVGFIAMSDDHLTVTPMGH